MKKLFTYLIPTFLVVLMLTACSEGSDKKVEKTDSTDALKEKEVYVVLKTLNTEYFKFIEAGAKDAFEDFGIKGTVIAPSEQTNFMEQINQLEDVLNKNTAGLVLTPSQPDTVVPILEKFHEKNIPVALLDSDVDWENKLTFIGNDDQNSGKLAGEKLASQLEPGDEVAILEGISGTPTSAARTKGALEALEEAGMKVVASQAADWDRLKATSVMEDILQAHPEIKGVIGVNDEMALGALNASKSKGKEIISIGIDGIIGAVESIKEGSLNASVAVKTYDMGYKGVESIVKAINNEAVDKEITTEIDVITEENASEILGNLKKILAK
ncbi:sugar ABC transporter substrate-binding protein [Sporosarcina newyorkensis]|uniref:Ribose transport system substrate-binding protein n=1 Tax=Sporosarcina newyorkensis TaxID=759851 RepID=A0A1T4YLK4_9BACL|nr:sugar ABC transporter substrate-binding protein [Sporosarcina newyorkensis]SKB02580.1 ribose transport system substrate-binding protein [Sporosarcina newyorkensis]